MSHNSAILRLLLLSSISADISVSEILKEDATVRAFSNGTPIVKLNRGLFVDTDFPQNDKVKINLIVFLNGSDFVSPEIVRKGTPLITAEGQKIGEAITDFEPDVLSDSVHGQIPGKFEVSIRGYISKSSIEPGSIAEEEVNSLILTTRGVVQSKALSSHLKKHRYTQPSADRDGFSSSAKYGSEQVGPPSIRVILVFHDSKLFAVIHPKTLSKSDHFPFVEDQLYTVQFFTKDAKLMGVFQEGFYFQFRSAG